MIPSVWLDQENKTSHPSKPPKRTPYSRLIPQPVRGPQEKHAQCKHTILDQTQVKCCSHCRLGQREAEISSKHGLYIAWQSWFRIRSTTAQMVQSHHEGEERSHHLQPTWIRSITKLQPWANNSMQMVHLGSCDKQDHYLGRYVEYTLGQTSSSGLLITHSQTPFIPGLAQRNSTTSAAHQTQASSTSFPDARQHRHRKDIDGGTSNACTSWLKMWQLEVKLCPQPSFKG